MLRHTSRRGSFLVPVCLGVGAFTLLVIVGLVLVKHRKTPKPSDRDVDVLAVAENNTPAEPRVPQKRPEATPQPAVPTPASEKQSATPAASPAEERLKTVQGHLAAGEFGPALAIAANVAGLEEKGRLLRTIADAQMQAGETEAAVRTLRGIPLEGERREAARDQIRQWASAAGGSGANFGPLKNLIQNETSGPWFDVDGVGGTMSQLTTGVSVDPNGRLSFLTRKELGHQLKSLGVRARQADLNEDMARASSLRFVSLTRLEREIRKRLDAGQSVVETMKNFAGLYKVEYVLVFPESGDIVVGGPAEGWRYNAKGQPVGSGTGKPTLQLDDFVTVLRTFSPEGDRYFNCLIVPRQEGLKRAKAINEAQKTPLSGNAGRINFVNRLTKALGVQDVEVNGVPADSRVARVIVEADYRMKLIGIDKLDAGNSIPSYFDLLAKNPLKTQPALNALRWWLTMKYDGVVHSGDHNVFQIQGSSVRCQGLNEKITGQGRRIHTGKADPVNRMFAVNFTRNYADLAKRDLVFADLQNIFDLSLVAALIRYEHLDRKTNWTGGVFATGGDYAPLTHEPIKTVMSVSNSRVYRGKEVVIQVAGGVNADILSVLKDPKLRKAAPRLGSMLAVKVPQLPEGRWWWDVKTAR